LAANKHRREILRHCRGSYCHANIFSDPNPDSHRDNNSNTDTYTKACAHTAVSSHTRTATVIKKLIPDSCQSQTANKPNPRRGDTDTG
jgi:hypothetical protein